ncbi:DUF1937 family protein [Pararhodobacter sp.]|uniref:DUF1937 family protein n=1 Tax=Pararhodobacter sp. TaxID=2127056 RepID=UPI002AFE20C5|nr:DUF1937 family protein [Pararhodobacter sp.]
MSDFWASLTDNPVVRFGVQVSAVPGIVSGQVYLATAYSKRVLTGGQFSVGRSRIVADAAAAIQMNLARKGVTAVSPIVQAHQMLVAGIGVPELLHEWALDAAFWTRWCAPMLDASTWVYVPDLPGWRESDGIRHEVTHALRRNKPVLIGGQA